MTKNEFLDKLRSALAGLPQEEIEKTIDYYCEIIDDAIEDGEDEQSVIGRMGIEDIVEKIINETPIRKFVKEDVRRRNLSTSFIILLILGSPIWFPVLTALVTVAFSLYIVIWTLVAVLFVVFAALAVSSVAMLIMSPLLIIARPIKAMFAFGSALVCAGAAVFMFYLSVWSAKLTVKFTLLMIRSIKNNFIKRSDAR
ncbi:MAG: DUF1700 domain-containing protein [Clostridia bacterium]|nr:DUF1700 domain-containing protein [Clostridia bacterium]